LTVAILQTLNIIADKIPVGYHFFDAQAKQFSALLFSGENIECLQRILDQSADCPTVQLSIDLAADLIAKLCTEDAHKVALAKSGVLDTLAVRLAAFVVAQGFVLPGAESSVNAPDALGFIPAPAPPGAELAPILRAIAVIIEHFKLAGDCNCVPTTIFRTASSASSEKAGVGNFLVFGSSWTPADYLCIKPDRFATAGCPGFPSQQRVLQFPASRIRNDLYRWSWPVFRSTITVSGSYDIR
jgi:hypothetical protein